jgi:hypothetical protein
MLLSIGKVRLEVSGGPRYDVIDFCSFPSERAPSLVIVDLFHPLLLECLQTKQGMH